MLPCRGMGPWLSTHSAPSKRGGWQRNGIHRAAPRPANPVTCFPPGKVVAPATKGGAPSIARQGGCMVLLIRGVLYYFKDAHHGLCPLSDSDATLGPCVSTGPYAPLPRSGRPLREYSPPPRRLVFTTIYHTFDVYRDPSLSLRMTVTRRGSPAGSR